MVIAREIEDINIKDRDGLAATVGFFDGVHQGHRYLIRQMQEEAARRGLPTAVITFPVHPRKVLQADFQPHLLNSFEEKVRHLAALGLDYCIALDFTRELSLLDAQTFIADVLSARWKVRMLLVGYDHRFGHERREGFEQYKMYGAACGMEVLQAGRYNAEATAVSSSEVRRLLLAGRVDEAARLLTYPYQLRGHIVGGHRVGRRIGFPTANIRVDEPYKLLPAIGVYAVKVRLAAADYIGMLYIGNRPTLDNGEDITLEVNILDFAGDIYEKEISVFFLYRLLNDIRFTSVEA
ncbi:MAG: riboflavin biosynthesis protein RibF [Tannerella sp.]|jgi:riboflavin kinase/FMN adenylyltransferase|nr:riboflavin biosynthesis protein RibF [Tannerella sp.]